MAIKLQRLVLHAYNFDTFATKLTEVAKTVSKTNSSVYKHT